MTLLLIIAFLSLLALGSAGLFLGRKGVGLTLLGGAALALLAALAFLFLVANSNM